MSEFVKNLYVELTDVADKMRHLFNTSPTKEL